VVLLINDWDLEDGATPACHRKQRFSPAASPTALRVPARRRRQPVDRALAVR
jgi:hypothetical protein